MDLKQKQQQPGLLINGNPRGNPNNAPRCLARTHRGTPCQAPRIRGKKRCRLHGGRAGRKPDPVVQRRKNSIVLYGFILKDTVVIVGTKTTTV